MITTRTAKQCGQADFGWLQARYTFSFGHYFDPKLLGFASLRVLNQEVLAPGASFQARTYPKVDILNLILEGEAEYRDSDGNHVQAKAGEALLIATQPGVSYSEHNLSKEQSLTRMQLWLDACPQRENPLLKGVALPAALKICTEIACVAEKELVVFATPSFAVRETAQKAAPYLGDGTLVLVLLENAIRPRCPKDVSDMRRRTLRPAAAEESKTVVCSARS